MDIKDKIDEKINSKKVKEPDFLVEEKEEEKAEEIPTKEPDEEEIKPQKGTQEEKIIAWFSENPNPSDKDLHAWAEENSFDIHEVETIVYKLATKMVQFLTGGRAVQKGVETDSVDAKELEMGIAVEKEHTTDAETAERIAVDHLSELPDYYTRLAKMEGESKPEEEPESETDAEEEEAEEMNEGISLDNLKKFDKSRTQTAVKRTIDTLIELEDNDVFEGNEASYVRSVVSIMQKVSHKLKHNIIQ